MIGKETKKLSTASPASHARGRTGASSTTRPPSYRPTVVPNTPSRKDRTSNGQGLQATASTFVDASVVLAATRAAVPVRVKVPYLHLEFGEQLKVVGENAALGNWYSNAAPFLSWTEGDTWIHHSQLPPGTHYFKLVIVRDGGSLSWEEGDNRSFEVPDSDVDGVLEVVCEFGSTATTDVSVVDASVLTERADTLGAESGSETDVNPEEPLTAAAGEVSGGDPAETEAASPPLPPPEAVEEVETLAAASLEESMFVEEVVPETAGHQNGTSEHKGVAAEELEPAQEEDVPAVEELVAVIAEPLAAVEEQPVSTAARASGAKAEEPEPTTFKTEVSTAAQALEEPAAVQTEPPAAVTAEEPVAAKAEEHAAFKAEEPVAAKAEENGAAEEAGKSEVQPVSHRPLSYTSNGSGFRTFGKATAAVLGEGSVVVTFSDDDEEDMATLTERLLAPKLPRRRGRQ